MDVEYSRKIILKMNKYKIRGNMWYGDMHIKIQEKIIFYKYKIPLTKTERLETSFEITEWLETKRKKKETARIKFVNKYSKIIGKYYCWRKKQHG